MKEMLFRLFSKLFSKELALMTRTAVDIDKAVQAGERYKAEWAEAEMYLGKPVIYYSNEIENPVVGFCTGIVPLTKADVPFLRIRNYITNEDTFVSGHWPSLQHFSEVTMNSLAMVDPNVLIRILHGRYYEGNVMAKKPRESAEPCLTAPQLVGRLMKNGFYEKLREYRDSQPNLKVVAHST